jgi:shikimate dehydrogenase
MDHNKAFVIGYPIRHSRSPLIHHYWLKKYAIAGSYEKIEVLPEKLASFLNDLERSGFRGGNVTIPHKEKVFEACAIVTDMARKVGAANTIWLENGRLCGDNTDVAGFLANLDAEAPGWDEDCNKAAVIGAGGAARAILAGLAARGVKEVKIVNRSADRMTVLADEASAWGFRRVATHVLGDPHAFDGEGLLVNTTSLGMVGQPPLSIDLDGLKPDALVSDIIYAPLETDLLGEAQRRGLRTSSGLGMLLYQAVPGFERWFGVRPEVTRELRDLVVADVRRAGG